MIPTESLSASGTETLSQTEPFGKGALLRTMPGHLQHLAMAGLAVLWAFEVTPGAGGRDRGPLLAGIAGLAVALAVLRPWRVLTARLVILPALAAAAALLDLFVTPLAWSHAAEVAWVLVGPLALLVVVAYARTPARRVAVVLGIVAMGGIQFAQALVPWWGSRDPNHLMWGTFYWHNQFAAYMLGTAVLAMGGYLYGPRILRVPGALVGLLACAGIVFSTSRTVLLLLVAGWLALAPLTARRAVAWLRWTTVVPAAAVVVWFLSSPVLFPSHRFTLAIVHDQGSRGLGTLQGNGDARWMFTRAALKSWWDSPLFGNGFGSFRYTVVDHVPVGSVLSPFVHDAPADWLTSGGLAFSLPLFLGLLAVAWCAGRYLIGLTPSGGGVLGRPAAIGLLVLMAHSLLDFDWTYPSLSLLFGAVAGVLVSLSPARELNPVRGSSGDRRFRLATASLPIPAVGMFALVGVTAIAAWGDGATRPWSAPSGSVISVDSVVSHSESWPPAPEQAAAIVGAAVAGVGDAGGGLRATPPQLRTVLAETAGMAQVDQRLAGQREVLRVILGEGPEPLGQLASLADRRGSHHPDLYADLALGRGVSGDTAGACAAVTAYQAAVGGTGASDRSVSDLLQRLGRLPGPSRISC